MQHPHRYSLPQTFTPVECDYLSSPSLHTTHGHPHHTIRRRFERLNRGVITSDWEFCNQVCLCRVSPLPFPFFLTPFLPSPASPIKPTPHFSYPSASSSFLTPSLAIRGRRAINIIVILNDSGLVWSRRLQVRIITSTFTENESEKTLTIIM